MKAILDSGQVIDLGATKATPTIGITDYSRRVTDDFGVTTVVERGFSRTMSVQVAVPFDRVDELQRTLAGLRATPVQWVADDRFASLSIRGFYKEFSIDVATSSLSFCTLSVEGLAGADVVADAGGDPAPEALRSTLQLLRPIAVAGAQLVASNVAEADAPEWAANKAYPSGVRVIKAATHRIYESLTAVPAGDDPAAASGKWLDVGPTNRWAMFDQALGSVTTANGSIAVAVDVGAIDAVAVLDVVGATVRVQAPDYDRTVQIAGAAISLLDLPNKAGRVTVTITGNSTVSVGTLLVGHRMALGLTEAAPTAGITDYSRKAIDDFGEVTVVERAWAKRMTANALIRTDAVDLVANRIAAVRAQPVLWIGRAGTDSLTVYGFFKDFSIEIGQAVSKLSLSIEGLSTAGKIEPLGTLVEWPDIADPAGTKPADSATKGGTLGVDIKTPAGSLLVPSEVLNSALQLLPDGTLVAQIGDTIRPLGTLKLPDMNAASDAARRQIETDLAMLAASVAQLAAGQQIAQNVFRDAGLYTDPESGFAKLFAIESRAEQLTKLSISLNAALSSINLKASVDYVDGAILKAKLDGSDVDIDKVLVRLTNAEANVDGLQASILLKADATIVTGLKGTVTKVQQDLDALNGIIATKASQTTVDRLGVRVTAAEQVIQAFDDVASITSTVTAGRRALADADLSGGTSILALLSGFDATVGALNAIALAKNDLRAVVDGNASAVASLSTQLAVQIGKVSALISAEQVARANSEEAIATDLARYKVAVNGSFGEVTRSIGTQADGLTAISGTVDTVSTTVNGHTRTLTVYGQSIDGLTLKWGAEFNSNGAVTGFALNNGASRTDATFVVDNFKIARPSGAGGATVVFSVADDGVIEMPSVRVGLLKAKSVTADNIVPGSVLRLSVQVLEAPVAIPWG